MIGTPVFAGTHVLVQNHFDYIEGGEDPIEFLNDFPTVSKDADVAVLKMAKYTLTTEKILHKKQEKNKIP